MKKFVSFCLLSVLFALFSLIMPNELNAQSCNPCLVLENTNLSIAPLEKNSLQAPEFGKTHRYRVLIENGACLDTSKISLEWKITRKGVVMGEDMSVYATVKLLTEYNAINNAELGGELPQGTPEVSDKNEIRSYPGAITVFPGFMNLAQYSLDFLYYRFYESTNTYLEITWGDLDPDYEYTLYLVERTDGTDYPSFYWSADQKENIGGHQSKRGKILAEYTLKPVVRGTDVDTIVCASNLPVGFGIPAVYFDKDTTVDVGFYSNDPVSGCKILDSIVEYTLTIQSAPTAPIGHDTAYCQNATAVELKADALANHILEWSDDGAKYDTTKIIPLTTTVGVFEYFVRQYDLSAVVRCPSPADTITVTINALPGKPVLIDDTLDYCLNETLTDALTDYVQTPAGYSLEWAIGTGDFSATVPVVSTAKAGEFKYRVRLENAATGCVSPDDSIATIVVLVHEPLFNLTSNKDSICKDLDITLSVDKTVYAYEWKTPFTGAAFTTGKDTTVRPANIGWNIYVVEATDAYGCIKLDTAKVYVKDLPVVTITADPTDAKNCAGDTVTLNAGDYVSYSWASGETTRTIKVTTAGWYKVTVEDKYGCTGVDSIQVSFITRPVITDNTSKTPVCSGKETLIEVYAGMGIVYAWEGYGVDTNRRMVTPVNNGGAPIVVNYIVTASETASGHNCSTVDTVKITVNPLPMPAILPLVDSICINSSIELTVKDTNTYSSANTTTYSWSNSLGTKDTVLYIPAVTGTTTLSVEATNGYNCIATATKDILVQDTTFIAIKPSNNPICEGDTITLEVYGAYGETINSWEWSTKETTSTIRVAPADTTVYSVAVTVVGNVCKSTATVQINVNKKPVASIIAKDTACVGGEMLLVALPTGPQYTYAWNEYQNVVTDTVTVKFTVPGDNLYTVSVTNSATGGIGTATKKIFVHALTAPNLSLSYDPSYTTFCSGDTVTITPDPLDLTKYNYSWTTGETTPSVKFSLITDSKKDTLITLTVVDKETKCPNDKSITLIYNPLPVVNISNDTLICAGSSVNLSANSAYYRYTWTNNQDATKFNSSTITVTPTATETVYTVNVTSIDGCKATDSVTVTTRTLPTTNITPKTKSVCVNENVGIISVDHNSDYSYSWTGVTAGDTNRVEVGAYSTSGIKNIYVDVTSTESGVTCTTRDSSVITVNELPNPTPYGARTIDVCALTDTVIGFNEDIYTYTWTVGGDTKTINIKPTPANVYADTTFKYYVNISNGNCTILDSIIVEVKSLPNVSISASPKDSVCQNESITLTASSTISVTFDWTANTLGTQHTENDKYLPSTATPGTTTYYVTGTETTYGCKETDSIKVTIIPLPSVEIRTNLTNDSICANDTIKIELKGGELYGWFNGTLTTTNILDTLITSPGDCDLTVRVKNAFGCYKDSTIKVVVKKIPAITLAFNPNDTICMNDTLKVTAGGGVSYDWGNGVTTAQLDTLFATAGSHSLKVTVTNDLGCTTDSTFKVQVNPIPSTTITKNDSVCASEVIKLATANSTDTIFSYSSQFITTHSFTYDVDKIAADTLSIDPNDYADTTKTIARIAYELVLQNQYGCKVTVNDTVAIKPLPLVNVKITAPDSTTNDICGFPAKLKATDVSHYDYYWTTTHSASATVYSTATNNLFAIDSTANGDLTVTVEVTNQLNCKNSVDTLTHIWNLPTLTLSGDNRACKDSIKITGSLSPVDYDYVWIGANGTVGTPDSIYYAKSTDTVWAEVTIPSTPCTVKAFHVVQVDSLPYMEIYEVGQYGTQPEIFKKAITSGGAGGYDLVVNEHCYNPETKVAIHFQISYNGVAIPDSMTQYLTNYKSISYNINTLASDDNNFKGMPGSEKSYLYYDRNASGYIPSGEGTMGHQFIAAGKDRYDWMYLHFLNNRPITINYDRFSVDGIYTITYTLYEIASSYPATNHTYDIGKKIGGHNVATYVKPLATRTIELYVGVTMPSGSTGDVSGDDTDDVITVITPVNANQPNVNLFPNPATNDMNLMINGIEGKTMISIYTITGKLIDQFETTLNANASLINYSFDGRYVNGTYLVRVVNNEAVITKKVIIAK